MQKSMSDQWPNESLYQTGAQPGGQSTLQFRKIVQNFQINKLLMYKPMRYFSANQRDCLRNLSQLLVEPDQSSVVC